MFKKSNYILMFLISFVLYFSLGIIFTYYIDTTKFFDLFFSSDTPRVIIDLTFRNFDHYRTIVHPLFVLFQFPVKFISILINNDLIAVLLLQSLLNAGSIILLFNLLNKFKLDKKIIYFLTFIFSISFGQIAFLSTVETYPYAQFFLLLLFNYIYDLKNRKFVDKDYIILTILGVFAIGITLTNYFMYCLSLFFLLKKDIKSIKRLLICIISPVLIAVTLSELQMVIFPGSRLFLYENLNGFINGTSEETLYMSSFSFNSILNQIKAIFGYGFFGYNIELINLSADKSILSFAKPSLIFMIFVFSLLILFIIVIFKALFNKKIDKKENKYLITLLLVLGFNFLLHLIYGNDNCFLYVMHYQFVIILILGMCLKYIKNKSYKLSYIVLSIISFIELFINSFAIYKIYTLLENKYPKTTDFYIQVPIIYIITIIFIIVCFILLIKDKFTKNKNDLLDN